MSENLSDGFSTSGAESDRTEQQESRSFHRIIDLTLTLRPGMRGVAFEPKFNFREHGWNAQTLRLYSHCGTHIDAPTHSEAGDQTIDLEDFFAAFDNRWNQHQCEQQERSH